MEGIVKTHRGAVTVESMLGQGSAFHVYLPIAKLTELPDRLKQDSVQTGTEHILFVDDEPILIEVAGKMLSRAGCKVETRASSIEALKLFEADSNHFDLVITDMTMPHLTGDQLAQKMIELRPDIPIILCTGYSALGDESRAEQIGIRAFVMKPLVASEITHAIRRVLDAG